MRVLRNAPSVYANHVFTTVHAFNRKTESWDVIPTWEPYVDASKATVEVWESDHGWEAALAAYLAGRNPTDSPEWKRGCFLCRLEHQ